MPEWISFTGYPASWNWSTYDPRSPGSAPAAASAPLNPYGRSIGLPAGAGLTNPVAVPPVLQSNATQRNSRSLWTPAGVSSSINGPAFDLKSNRNWRRNRNSDNGSSGHKANSGFGDGPHV